MGGKQRYGGRPAGEGFVFYVGWLVLALSWHSSHSPRHSLFREATEVPVPVSSHTEGRPPYCALNRRFLVSEAFKWALWRRR